MALAPGTKLGPYEILAPLGAGGMGEVYRARDTSLRREVAIKILVADYALDTDRLRRFTQEAQATAALNHPNILSIFHIGERESKPYIVSELLEGHTLRHFIEVGRLSGRRAIDYAIQIARGLAAAHGKGIIHRDLKPDNIFVTNDGRVKILDFGLAKLVEHAPVDPSVSPTRTGATEAGVVLGTAGYMSPEQVRGESVDSRSDLFSFGVVMYEMLSGRQPFLRNSGAETLSAILKEEPPPLDPELGVTPALQRIVQHCLEKDPAARFQSAQDLAFDLESLSSLSSQQAHGEARSEGGARWLKPAVIGGLVVMALVIGGFVRALYNSPGGPTWKQLTYSRGMVSAARFGPDGQVVVYSAAWNGKPYDIFATRPESPESRSLDLRRSNLSAVSSRSELLVTQEIQVVGPGVFTGTLARVPMEGGTPREMMHDAQFADWAPDGTTFATVHQIRGKSILEYPAGHVLAESGGRVVFPRISPTGDEVAYFEYRDPTLDYGKVMLVKQNGEKKVLADNWTDLSGLAWGPTGEEVWFTGSRDNGTSELYAVPLGGKTRLIFKQLHDLQLMDVARDGRVLLVSMSWRGEMYGAFGGDTAERDLGWLDFTVPDDISADGRVILFHEAGEGGGPGFVTYLRSADGSPPVKLGEGNGSSLSPDREWVVSNSLAQPSAVVLIPTKAGISRSLSDDGLNHAVATWFPDGKRLLLTASEPGQGIRLYIGELDGKLPRPISAEGIAPLTARVSPDGKWVAANTDLDKILVFPVDAGDPYPVPGIGEREVVVGCGQDSRSLFVATLGELPVPVYRVDIDSGKRELWKRLSPPDPSGVNYFGPIVVAQDGRSYVYGLDRRLSELYVVTGLK